MDVSTASNLAQTAVPYVASLRVPLAPAAPCSYPNTTGLGGYNEQWSFSGAGQITSKMNGLCLAADVAVAGADVSLQDCSSDPLQAWTFDMATGVITNGGGPGLCLDAGSFVNCSMPPLNAFLYCDPDASTEARLADLVPRILPAEFPQLLSNSNNGVPRLGIPAIGFSECLHGPLTGCGAPYTNATTGYTSTGCPTSFPHLLLQGSTFNRSLWSAIGGAIGDEDRGLHNQNQAGSMVSRTAVGVPRGARRGERRASLPCETPAWLPFWRCEPTHSSVLYPPAPLSVGSVQFWAPDINEFRDPRWGRGQE